ncbi:MAG: IS3 family transposase [Anaerolineae bacterium]|nr:IS3 family transposase [Anaerolineae bacterium]
MDKRYRTYTQEFKLEALELLMHSGKSAAQLERELGITKGLLLKWRGPLPGATGGGAVSLAPTDLAAAQAEVRQLRRQLAIAEQERDILKKSGEHFQSSRGLKYAFIAGHAGEYAVRRMCQVLGVSPSGYYAWLNRPPSARQQTNEPLLAAIRGEYDASRQTYGSPRIHAALRQQGLRVGRKRVARLMRSAGLVAKGPWRKRPRTTQRAPEAVAAPNLLGQDFTASRPNEKWVADITYIETLEGWLYLALVLDLFSRAIVGWAMADHLRATLVESALQMALGRRTPDGNLLHHSDQGSQYTSTWVQTLLAQHHIQVSMNGVGNCYDNAPMESFIGTLKTECADAPFATRAEARRVIFEYLEVWYNRQRLHSSLGYVSPAAFDQQYADEIKTVR